MVNTRKAEDPYSKITSRIEKSKLTVETKEILGIILSLFSTIQSDKDETIRQLQQDLTKTKRKLTDYETKFTNEIEEIKKKQDETDQYERRDTLIITGQTLPQFQMGENLKNTIHKMFN